MTRYSEPEPGEWIRPKPVGYKLACCDCGLVHRYDFRVVDRHVEFRVWPANRETGQMRRHMKPGETAAPVAGEPDRGAEGRDTYRPDPVEGRRQTLRCGTCHRTVSRCKCAGRGLAELPKRIVVGKNGAYWRDYGDHYSMCPVSEDNDPVEPVAMYVLQRPEDWFPEAEHAAHTALRAATPAPPEPGLDVERCPVATSRCEHPAGHDGNHYTTYRDDDLWGWTIAARLRENPR